MYEQDLTLNDQQWLICHKTQPANQCNSEGMLNQQQQQSAYQKLVQLGPNNWSKFKNS